VFCVDDPSDRADRRLQGELLNDASDFASLTLFDLATAWLDKVLGLR
jgi:hypothetical protein